MIPVVYSCKVTIQRQGVVCTSLLTGREPDCRFIHSSALAMVSQCLDVFDNRERHEGGESLQITLEVQL